MHWWKRAADKGDMKAQFGLGRNILSAFQSSVNVRILIVLRFFLFVAQIMEMSARALRAAGHDVVVASGTEMTAASDDTVKTVPASPQLDHAVDGKMTETVDGVPSVRVGYQAMLTAARLLYEQSAKQLY